MCFGSNLLPKERLQNIRAGMMQTNSQRQRWKSGKKK